METSQYKIEPTETAQQRFDRLYISSVEIMEQLGVSRTTISQARKRNLLPNAIVSHGGSMVLWEREALRPNLEAWKLMLSVRRQHTA
jgi:hypothetical protein